MTDRQKKAIRLLNELRYASEMRPLTDDEYYELLEFVMTDIQTIQYVPYGVSEEPKIFPPVTYEITCRHE